MQVFRKNLPVTVIAVVWTCFQLYLAATGPIIAQMQRSFHVALALALTFALVRRGEKSRFILIRGLDYVFVLMSLFIGIYVYVEFDRLVSRMAFVSDFEPMDYAVAIMVTLLVLEASRRTVGYAMTILAVLFLIYGFFGPYFPGLLNHNGLSLKRMVEIMFFSGDGILGVPIGVSVDFVFYFVLFAAFLEVSGGGKLFMDIAFKVTSRSVGGPAKAAVVASSGMGTISGSAVANVVSTGVMTIPLMIKTGFSRKFAASVEALASNGGQILPPIMGAAAFLMANTLGVPYTAVVISAIVPAFLYYAAVFTMVHLHSRKIGLKPGGNETAVTGREILAGSYLLIPLMVLVILIFSGMVLQKAAFYSILLIAAVSYLRRSTAMRFSQYIEAFVNGAKQAVQVAIPCAVAGIIVGVVIHTGLGLKFTSLIIEWSFGIRVISILLVALACIIMGMGMPTTSAYIMASVLLAPALQQFGYEPMAVHMFVMYFAVFAMITPPVALATFAASSIAKSNANETGFYAFYLSIPIMIIPFSFLINPELLLIGRALDNFSVAATTLLGVVALTGAVINYLFGDLKLVPRLLLVAAAVCLIIKEPVTDIIGLLLFAAIAVMQYRSLKRSERKISPAQP